MDEESHRQSTEDGVSAGVPPVIDLGRHRAVAFDIDGVVTDTARVHAAAWKRVFDEFLRARAREQGVPLPPFDIRDDYLRYVNGKPRLDGIRGFLASRRITLPEGGADDPMDAPTVHGLGRCKEVYFLAQLRRYGVTAFPSTVRLLEELRARGASTAAVSASRNAGEVLVTAGVSGLFDVTVDGWDAARLGLAGKPDPALFLETARRLHAPPRRAVVIEDALAGVEAGCRGGFGLVVGVDRGFQSEDLLRFGADVVVKDLGQLSLVGRVR
jgi:beta-phosphoglucomutase family hydrolase